MREVAAKRGYRPYHVENNPEAQRLDPGSAPPTAWNRGPHDLSFITSLRA